MVLEEGEIPPEQSNGQTSVTFFLSNLPDGVATEILREECGRCGQLSDVYVARKRDRFGKLFAFVRFVGVSDVHKMTKALNSLNGFGRRLFAKVARFSKEDSRARNGIRRPVAASDTGTFQGRPSGHDVRAQKENVTFRESLVGGSGENGGNPELLYLDDETDVIKRAWLGRSVIGQTKNYSRLCRLIDGLHEIKNMRMEVRYVGGLKVLITFSNPEKMKEFLTIKETWAEWFSEVFEWTGQVWEFERLTWIKITGLPLIISSEENVKRVGAKFGVVIKEAENGVANTDLSGAYVGVLTKIRKRIEGEVRISWRGETFDCWVSEGSGRWLPEYIGVEVTCIGADDDTVELQPIVTDNMDVNEQVPDVDGSSPAAGNNGGSDGNCNEQTGGDNESSMHGKTQKMDGATNGHAHEKVSGGGTQQYNDNNNIEKIKLIYYNNDNKTKTNSLVTDNAKLDSHVGQDKDFSNNVQNNKWASNKGEIPRQVENHEGGHPPEQNDGETPIPPSMGKRSRNLRSPPSLGSTQAPPSKVCYGDFPPRSKPNNLNSIENQPMESVFEDVRSHDIQGQADVASGEQPHKGLNALLGGSGEQFSSGESATVGSLNQQKIGPIFCFGSREKMEQIINGAINSQNYLPGSTEKDGQRGETVRKKWSRRIRNPSQQDQVSAENGGVYNNTRTGGNNLGR